MYKSFIQVLISWTTKVYLFNIVKTIHRKIKGHYLYEVKTEEEDVSACT